MNEELKKAIALVMKHTDNFPVAYWNKDFGYVFLMNGGSNGDMIGGNFYAVNGSKVYEVTPLMVDLPANKKVALPKIPRKK